MGFFLFGRAPMGQAIRCNLLYQTGFENLSGIKVFPLLSFTRTIS